jgi:hypothetical protein
MLYPISTNVNQSPSASRSYIPATDQSELSLLNTPANYIPMLINWSSATVTTDLPHLQFPFTLPRPLSRSPRFITLDHPLTIAIFTTPNRPADGQNHYGAACKKCGSPTCHEVTIGLVGGVALKPRQPHLNVSSGGSVIRESAGSSTGSSGCGDLRDYKCSPTSRSVMVEQ